MLRKATLFLKCHPSDWSEDLFCFHFHSALFSCCDSTFCANCHSVPVSSFTFPLNRSVTLSLLPQCAPCHCLCARANEVSAFPWRRRSGVRTYDLEKSIRKNLLFKLPFFSLRITIGWVLISQLYSHLSCNNCQRERIIILWDGKRYWLIDHVTLTFLE